MSAEPLPQTEPQPLMRLDDVSKIFRVRGKVLRAVSHVSFDIAPGQTVGLVGESGSGKSTVGRVALGLLPADGGHVWFDGKDLTTLSEKQIRPLRRHMQLIFQDPQASLSPRMTIGDAIMDGLVINHIGSRKEREQRMMELLDRVGLPKRAADSYPHELSGGQLQRVGIARALAVNPKIIVCDEPVSALDVSIQVQIIQLLQELQREMNLAYIFISHNLAVVEYLSDIVVVLYLGEVVEVARADRIFQHPGHPYTRVLIESILKVPESVEARQPLVALSGEIPSPLDPPPGCPFHSRCPMAQEICTTTIPEMHQVDEDHTVKCHFAG